MRQVKSAGIVIVRKVNTQYNVLLMRSYSYWDFPKGGIEPNETPLQAAIREVGEESGITDLKFNWNDVNYTTEKYGKQKKTVTYFMAETTQSKVIMGISPALGRPEHDEYRWVTFNEARELSINRIVKVLNWAEAIILNGLNDEYEFKYITS